MVKYITGYSFLHAMISFLVSVNCPKGCKDIVEHIPGMLNTHEKLSCSLSNTIEASIPPRKLEKVLNKKCKKSEMCSPCNKQR
jgi:hypothetical protein